MQIVYYDDNTISERVVVSLWSLLCLQFSCTILRSSFSACYPSDWRFLFSPVAKSAAEAGAHGFSWKCLRGMGYENFMNSCSLYLLCSSLDICFIQHSTGKVKCVKDGPVQIPVSFSLDVYAVSKSHFFILNGLSAVRLLHKEKIYHQLPAPPLLYFLQPILEPVCKHPACKLRHRRILVK